MNDHSRNLVALEEIPATGLRSALLADLIPDLLAEAEALALARATGQPRGPVTGLSLVDELLGGFLASGVHILQAAPAAGKTASALQIGATCGFPCLYVTSEMRPIDLFLRVIARTTGEYLGRLTSGELPPPQVARLAQRAAGLAPGLAILDGTVAYASVQTIRDAAEALRDRFESPHVLVILDSLQYWARGSSIPGGDYERVSGAV